MSDEILELLKHAGTARREGRLSESKRVLAEAIRIARGSELREELGHALRELGELDRQVDDGTAARGHYEEAVEIFREVGPVLKLAHTIRHLGDVYYAKGAAALAEPCFVEALELYRSHADPSSPDMANAIRSLAVLKFDAAEDEQAIPLWEEARTLYEKAHVHQGVAEASLRLATLARRRGDIEQARQWLREAIHAAEASGDLESLRHAKEVKAQFEF